MKLYVKFLRICIVFLFSSLSLARMEYFYPVANLRDVFFLIAHQKFFDDIEVLYWNSFDKTYISLLASWHIPSEITLLPNGQGFSFLDKGQFRIYDFFKRTPRTLYSSQPLEHMHNIKWIADNQFTCNAQLNQYYKAFLCTITDHACNVCLLQPLEITMHFLYSQKIQNLLFSIVKYNDLTYDIAMHDFNDYQNISMLHVKQSNPYCFLHMINQSQGFVLEIQLDDQIKQYILTCSELKKNPTDWQKNSLFSFMIPCEKINGWHQDRIFESIRPLLPVYTNEFIYFVNYNAFNGKLEAFVFNRQNASISPLVMDGDQPYHDLLSPIICDNQLIMGMSIDSSETDFLSNAELYLPSASLPTSQKPYQ